MVCTIRMAMSDVILRGSSTTGVRRESVSAVRRAEAASRSSLCRLSSDFTFTSRLVSKQETEMVKRAAPRSWRLNE